MAAVLAIAFGVAYSAWWPAESSAQGTTLLAGQRSLHQIALFDPRSGERIATLNTAPHQPSCIGLSRDGRLVATSDTAGVVRMWDLRTRKEVWGVDSAHQAYVGLIAFPKRRDEMKLKFQASAACLGYLIGMGRPN